MTTTNLISRHSDPLFESFNNVKANPMNLEVLMHHIMYLSQVVDELTLVVADLQQRIADDDGK